MEIKLKRNGWHRRLQIFVLGSSAPNFMNFCPYFWITNFCILITFIIPIVPLIKLLVWLFKGIGFSFEMFADWFEHSICEPLFKNSALGMDDETLIKSWSINSRYTGTLRNEEDWADYAFWTDKYFKKDYSDYNYRKREEMDKKFDVWKANTPNWEAKLAKIKEDRKKDWDARQAQQEKNRQWLAEQEIKNRAKIERAKAFKAKAFVLVVKYTKWFAIALGLAIASWVCYIIYLLGIYICDHFYYDRFITVMKWISLIVGCIAVVLGIGYIFAKLFKSIACRCLGLCKIFDNKLCRFLGKYILMGLVWLGKGIIIVVMAIGGFFKFFIDYIMAVKKDYCPGIHFVDDDQ